MTLSSETLLEGYKKMVTIRIFEDEVAKKFRDGSFPRHAHTYQGQEAVAAGVCLALTKEDFITSTHRGHGHLIAKGGDLSRAAAEFAGRASGYCKGKGGEMHVIDLGIGMLGAISIVGGGIPLAVGSGLASQVHRDNRVTACFFGDGAANQGTFHEGLNLAAAWRLPVVFICENNLYAMTVRSREVTPVDDLSVRAQAYGIPGLTVDGASFTEVYDAATKAIVRARAGEGPTLIECKTFRFEAHATVFPPTLHPAPKSEIEAWKKRDPIEHLFADLEGKGLMSTQDKVRLHAAVQDEVEQAIRFALDAPWPDGSEATEDVLAPEFVPEISPPSPGIRDTTYVKALNEALREEMSADQTVIVLGEDVELLGGLYGVTRDLSKEFGDRVRDTPISENSFTGAGIGAAVRGCRPVVELMYMDFFALAMDQIVNLGAKLHYMTGGQVKVPVVIRTATGAGGGGSATHSQSLEAWFYHVPGLKVVMPSTPFDAKGLLKTAIRDNSPVIFLEHKSLYQSKGPVPEHDYCIPFGEAVIRRPGKDVTVIATGAMVNEALKAAEQLWSESRIDLEIIDPRTLVPLDLETLVSSVMKTRKAVIFNEATSRGSFASDVAAQIGEAAFDVLDAPVMVVGMPPTPIPFSPALEREIVPSATTLIRAIKSMLGNSA
jgi:2-oxoisovalerate dehydrogenase E1 component